MGCTPHAIANYGTNGLPCADNINRAVKFFNKRLISLLDALNNNLTDANFIFINIYDMTIEGLANHSSLGFRVANTGCCGLGKNNGLLTCLPLQVPCFNRTEYVFWDAFHPTKAANIISARRSYAAQNPSDAYPIDISRFARL
ncbi:unnamed protein product [Ilex paraguariensis]|uniref:GDSL esterase/lipase n=1 Tax=Ilex paraguariensis TaxID=185542 RepID=A0ABC8RWJ3_9AQUA